MVPLSQSVGVGCRKRCKPKGPLTGKKWLCGDSGGAVGIRVPGSILMLWLKCLKIFLVWLPSPSLLWLIEIEIKQREQKADDITTKSAACKSLLP